MDKLCVVVAAGDVSAEIKADSKSWKVWKSKTHPQEPEGSGKFHFDYSNNHEERVVVLKGQAALTPDDGSPEVTIKKGDYVIFKQGFKCNWHVTKEMEKSYCYFDENGEVCEPIACDICGGNCWKESYFLPKTEEDICVPCFKAKGGRKGKFFHGKSPEYQQKGEPADENTDLNGKRAKEQQDDPAESHKRVKN
uniref:(S)-ureidoglycine aminohydrolase cupin domain-containing protein n=1 Tax=Aplanochytrium stocchinoi TaxID=215587 RepID=A0A6S8F2N4_9STRA|mmetsp:Transcript_1760/g.2648  ORF Transcript_1760/g.2648 Transcript_1760/m.2648 type:complete len:194 (+) Transcript_1760:250-831(+)|eukprot:CAMPEP_0204833606 /NCGR_PEP_ID=MMETSP1346-20131115/17192_1 /ASSEMBLY_ACC=CAM_ASM_000771 /TAXON_ID=215587 /ORGANISM="Aplanochytrium stocchinoi, Strain GSBS06" /LENGTH=193 /DNA_ID=CAMNT_0051966245 /DNA_START=190 /DNA_END=771 /DNA_ORIENTATION=-